LRDSLGKNRAESSAWHDPEAEREQEPTLQVTVGTGAEAKRVKLRQIEFYFFPFHIRPVLHKSGRLPMTADC
jgi:hypothetical protein